MRTSPALLALALAVALLPVARAAPAASEPETEPRNRVGITFLSRTWNDLGDRSPTVPGYDASQVGAFESDGMGLEMSWLRLLRRSRSFRIWSGLELGGSWFDNSKDYVLFDLVSGKRVEGSLDATLGAFTAAGRLVRGRGPLRLVLGAGAGLYMFRTQETIEDFGYVDAGYDDSGPGGYALAGVEYRFDSPVLVRLEVKVHVFDLGTADGLFPASLGGSSSSFALGVDWQSGRPR